MKNIHDDIAGSRDRLHETRDLAHNRPLWRLMSARRYALVVVHASVGLDCMGLFMPPASISICIPPGGTSSSNCETTPSYAIRPKRGRATRGTAAVGPIPRHVINQTSERAFDWSGRRRAMNAERERESEAFGRSVWCETGVVAAAARPR